MRKIAVAVVVLVVTTVAGSVRAQQAEPCDLPGYLLFGDARMDRVSAKVKETRQINIAVMGTGSSALSGPDGAQSGYPMRLQLAMRRLLPEVTVNVVSLAKSRQTSSDMAKDLKKMLVDLKPALVLWQTGTVDAIRGVNPEEFRRTLEKGVTALQAGGADVVLINMQYSPRTESMIQIEPYADSMRAVARERNVVLFDRLNLMRYWGDTGAFDFSAETKDRDLAIKVHDCLGQALALLIVEAAGLEKTQRQVGQ